MSREIGFSLWRFARILALAALAVGAAGVGIFVVHGAFDYEVGRLSIVAHSPFKPLLIFNGAFLLLLLLNSLATGRSLSLSLRSRPSKTWLTLWFIVYCCTYAASTGVNFYHHDWTHRHISAGIDSLAAVRELFLDRQADGFHRPVGFLSLWLDYRIFGASSPWYHIQSILLHACNALLAAGLAGRLGFSESTQRWTFPFVLFTPCAFEPVLWPAARFDLLAVFFSLVCVLFVLDYWRTARFVSVLFGILSFALAALTKESAYSVIPVLGLVAWRTKAPWKPLYQSMLLIASTAVVLLTVRIAIYGSLGGYGFDGGAAGPHFSMGWRTVTSLLMRVPAMGLLTINTTLPSYQSAVWQAVLLAWLLAVVFFLRFGSRPGEQGNWLTAVVVVASLPVLNIVAWFGPSMQHARYLYWPGIWLLMFLASTVRAGRRGYLALALVILMGTAARYNYGVYESVLIQAHDAGHKAVRECANMSGCQAIELMNLPTSASGVFYFGDEVRTTIQAEAPHVTVIDSKAGLTVDPAPGILRLNVCGTSLMPQSKPCT